jgi:hypothetical protein
MDHPYREQQDLHYPAARLHEKGCWSVWGWRCHPQTPPLYFGLYKYLPHPTLEQFSMIASHMKADQKLKYHAQNDFAQNVGGGCLWVPWVNMTLEQNSHSWLMSYSHIPYYTHVANLALLQTCVSPYQILLHFCWFVNKSLQLECEYIGVVILHYESCPKSSRGISRWDVTQINVNICGLVFGLCL